MALNEAFETRTRMHEQMKAVRNVPGRGRRSIGSLGICAGAVTTNQAEVRVGTKPGLDCGSAPILKQIHHPVGLQIDDHCSIGLAFTKSTIIQPDRGQVRKSRRPKLPQLPA